MLGLGGRSHAIYPFFCQGISVSIHFVSSSLTPYMMPIGPEPCQQQVLDRITSWRLLEVQNAVSRRPASTAYQNFRSQTVA